MLTFPYTALTDAPAEGASVKAAYPTEIVESRSGVEQRRGLSVLPRHTVAVKWENDMNAATRVDTLYDFYCQCRGQLYPFVYFDFDVARTWKTVYVGAGTGAKTVYDLPSLNASAVTVYVNGTPTAGTFSAGTGTNGRDKFTFSPAPANGAAITVTFTGRRALAMRFADDSLSYNVFSNLLYSTGVNLIEVVGES